jgi:electron transfer flavoprotein beta subunit
MKNIIVCIKQVPDTNEVKIDKATNTLVREGVPSIINPFDENAIETAVSLKEKYGARVIVISMGPPQAEEALKKAWAMGADEVILISDRAFAGSDTWATSYVLSKTIEKINSYDLIIFGKQAIDGDTAQVGPGVAELLNLPQITYVSEIEYIKEDKAVKVKREIEDGYEMIESKLPAVMTVLKEVNEPRYPSFKKLIQVKKMAVEKWGASQIDTEENNIGLDGSPTKVVKIFNPPPKGSSEIFNGPAKDMVQKLYKEIKNKKII